MPVPDYGRWIRQRKEQLTAQLTLPVAVLGLLGSAIVAIARSFSYV